jgi:Family of unknown function (DUF5367)
MKRVVILGLTIWLIATLALRFWGQHLFNPSSIPSIAILLAGSAPLMFWLPRWIFRRQAVPPADRALAAIALVAPGMLLDAFSTIWFPLVFPNIRPDAGALFGGWLLLCNVLVLVSAAFISTSAVNGQSKVGI